MKFKTFIEAEDLGLDTPSSTGLTAAKELGLALFNATPFGTITDLFRFFFKVKEARKQNKNIKPVISKMMTLKDNTGRNIFVLDDDLSLRLTEKAKIEIVDMIISDLDKAQYDPKKLPDNFANIVAARYLTKLATPWQPYQ